MELQIVTFFSHLGAGTFLDKITFFISDRLFLLGLWVVFGVLAVIFDKKNGKWVFLGIIIAALIYFVINDFIIKPGIANFLFRERPYIAYPSRITLIGVQFTDSSFYSGHMASTASFVTLFCYFYRKRWVWATGAIFVILMGFARMHNGMHYPSDVLFGTMFGIGYGLITAWIVNLVRGSKI